MSKVDIAMSKFSEGFNVSQSMLATFGPELGVDENTASKLTAAIPGHGEYTGDICGTILSGLMILGLLYGNTEAGDKDKIDKMQDLCDEFVAEFKARNGSIICSEMLGVDVSTDAGWAEVERQCMITDVCSNLMRDAVEILEMIIAENEA